MNEYGLAKLAGRLNWTWPQVTSVSLDIALLCDRFGWRGIEGYERLRMTPRRSLEEFIVIAGMESERERKRAND